LEEDWGAKDIGASPFEKGIKTQKRPSIHGTEIERPAPPSGVKEKSPKTKSATNPTANSDIRKARKKPLHRKPERSLYPSGLRGNKRNVHVVKNYGWRKKKKRWTPKDKDLKGVTRLAAPKQKLKKRRKKAKKSISRMKKGGKDTSRQAPVKSHDGITLTIQKRKKESGGAGREVEKK